jgi:arsenate reductase-like glutaredoxin family protein
MGGSDALSVARAASKIVVAKGKKVVEFDMKKAPPSDDELLKHMLGPTGNLRAPTIRKGKTLLVGFDEGAYAAALG